MTFPEINTERLILRKIEESDSEVILFLRSDKTINKFIDRPENRKTKNISDAINHIKKLNIETENNKSFSWGITLKSDLKIIGTICLWNFSENNKIAEVGYDLNPIFQRKGIMSEALSILEIGCGPGRHAISLRKLNYKVSAIDISEQIIEQAKKNEINVFGNTEILFSVTDMFKLKDHFSNEEFSLITHGGLMEHFEDNKLIIQNLKDKLSICKFVIFDIPIKSRKNDNLFQKDTIYRNLKSVPEWISLIETEFKVLEHQIEKHAPQNMTDDLIIVAGKHGI